MPSLPYQGFEEISVVESSSCLNYLSERRRNHRWKAFSQQNPALQVCWFCISQPQPISLSCKDEKMAGAIVGGAVLSAALQVLFDRIASRPVIDFIRGRKLSDAPLWKLKTIFSTVGALLNDAEDKQFNNRAVKAWLHELKDATYDAEDLLDEIVTEASRCKLEAESRTYADQLRNYMSTFRNPFDEGIKSKIEEILNRLEYIAERKDFLGLREVAGGERSRNFPTTSLVEESGMFGRDDDKKEIIKTLLSDGASGNELDVITIVGMGGLGKTTLARFVYNDDKVEKHFDLKAWVCVSDESDVLGVTKTIFEAITGSTCDNIKDLNMLQMKLKEKFSSKKFLLVLDDVWNDNYIFWETLQRPFKFGAKGSRVIVTTRKESVASSMGTVPAHHLKLLVEEDCWSLFAKHAFNNGNSSAHPHLEVIGREIVNKCKGLPLAAKALGGLLRSKLDVEEWNKVLRSNIWDLPSDILPALRLSYHYLPSDLKQCFAYCAIFPNDYEFEKERLILLWMAEGFLQHPYENRRMEEVGEDCFRDLASRSFFQPSTRDKSRFVMHDLINDLAKIVYGEFCSRLEGENQHQIPKKTRHLSYIQTDYDLSKKFEAFNDAKRLRTFLPLKLPSNYHRCQLTKKVPHDLLLTRNYLRVLSLSHYENIDELPESIGSLKHLRYLDLSFTAIRRLPNSTTTLFNLQTLLLSNCGSLIELPTDMGKLINLRCLDVSGTSLKEMPMHMSRLKSLQTLSTFIVGNCNGSTITELRKFQHLRGALHIMELQKVDGARDALQANLKNREYLDELVLEWGSSNENSQVERDVLGSLQPHANFKKLTIKHYRGTRFPDWVGDHSLCGKMVSLCLENCKYCFSLPSLGQLPCLKDLSIIGFDGVEIVGTEFYGNGSCTNKPFGALEILRFEEMSQWVEWLCLGDEGGEFPLLRELYIEKCPKLTKGLPGHLPSLTSIVISECQLLVASLPRAPSIREVELIDCNKVVLRRNDEVTLHPSLDVPQSSNVTSCQAQPHDDQMTTTLPNPVGLQHLCFVENLCVSCVTSQLMELPPCLRSLTIRDCPCLKSFPKGGLPTTLTTLQIHDCRELELFPREEEEAMHNHYASLESLFIIRSCDSLKSFPLGLFPKLHVLYLNDCKNVESLCIPEEGLLEDLKFLYIFFCPKFVSFPKGGLPTPNLSIIYISNCENLKSLPERMHTRLSSLQELHIVGCPELESSPEGGLPFKLMKVTLSAHQMEWGSQTLPSLTEFSIGGCKEVESFPEEWLLPSTLTSLRICRCPNLKYLDKSWLQHLTSLEKLEIWTCPLLKQRCQREKGKDWPNIAHIPCIVIDGELIS